MSLILPKRIPLFWKEENWPWSSLQVPQCKGHACLCLVVLITWMGRCDVGEVGAFLWPHFTFQMTLFSSMLSVSWYTYKSWLPLILILSIPGTFIFNFLLHKMSAGFNGTAVYLNRAKHASVKYQNPFRSYFIILKMVSSGLLDC